jgi:hypothetical protein
MIKTPEALDRTTLLRRRSYRQGGLPQAGSVGRSRSAALKVPRHGQVEARAPL